MKTSRLLVIVFATVSFFYFGIVLAVGFLFSLLSVNFWINIGFMLLITVVDILFILLYSMRDKTYLPFVVKYVRAMVIYAIIAVILSLSMMFIVVMPWVISFAIHLTSLIIFIIYVAFSSIGISHISNVHEKQMSEVKYLDILETKLCEARDNCNNSKNKSTYEKIIRMVQNSSYKSFLQAIEVENELLSKADELLVSDDEQQEALLKQMYVLINKRNNIISMARR